METNMLYDILLDIGGTGIKGGFFSVENKTISDSYHFISNADKEKEVIIKHLSSICSQIWDEIEDDDKRIRNIRMAFPGPFDYKKGISKVKGLAKYESLLDVSIPNEMMSLSTKENYLFIPKNDFDFKFINDVEAYALGVMNQRKFFQGYRVIYLCIGTGSGSAYSVNGKIAYDSAQGIPENGWVYPISYQDSIIDDYISVRGINKLAQKYCNKVYSPLELSMMVKNGNDHALQAYREFGDHLNAALLPLLKRFRANTFVIGGNISHSSEMFITPIKESCKELGIDIIIESDTSNLVMIGLTML
jgi:glucokinase